MANLYHQGTYTTEPSRHGDWDFKGVITLLVGVDDASEARRVTLTGPG
jgi:hypothetical protein